MLSWSQSESRNRRKMWTCFSIVAFLTATGLAKEVAVLIGGQTGVDYSYDPSVDVYTNHLKDDEKVCEETGKEPTIPDLPFALSDCGSAIFLPNHGIYVCGYFGDSFGNWLGNCWRYDPRVNK